MDNEFLKYSAENFIIRMKTGQYQAKKFSAEFTTSVCGKIMHGLQCGHFFSFTMNLDLETFQRR